MRKTSKRSANDWLVFFTYILLIILLGSAATVTITNSRKINKRYDKITDMINTKMSMLLSLRENSEIIQTITIDKVFHPKRIDKNKNQLLSDLTLKTNNYLKQFQKILNSENEKNAFNKLNKTWLVSDTINQKFLRLSNNEAEAILFYHTDQQKAYNNFLAAISSFSVAVKENLNNEDDEVDRVFFNSYAKVDFLIGAAIIILIAIGIIIYRDIKKLRSNNKLLTEKDKRIQESEQTYKHLFDKGPVFNWVCEIPSLRHLEVNEIAMKTYGYSKEEFLSMTAFDLLPEEEREGLKDRVRKNGTVENFYDQDRHVKKNGEIIDVDIRVHLINHKGKPAGLVFGVDVTEKLKAEKALKESEELYRSFFENSPLPIWVCDRNTLQFYEVNDAAIKLYGYTKEEFLHLSAFDIRPIDEHERINQYLENHNSPTKYSGIRNHRKKGGELIRVDIALDTITYKGKDALLIVINDITEKIRLQNELIEEKNNHLREVTKATIAGQEKERAEVGKELHDNVNQILASAKLYLSSALTTSDKKDEMMEESKKLIDSGIQEIRKLSKSLVPPSLGKSTLQESIEQLVDPVRIITDKKIETSLSLTDETILCNHLKITIYRIIQEQMNNIMKYADATLIRIILKQEKNTIWLVVSDNGKGFDVKAKRKGIGLTNITNRAEVYNGKVSIKSSPGNGCSLSVLFTLSLENQSLCSPVADSSQLSYK